jgi:hypothetical protein
MRKRQAAKYNKDSDVWFSAQAMLSGRRSQIFNFDVYDQASGDVALTLEGVKYSPCEVKSELYRTGLFDVQWRLLVKSTNEMATDVQPEELVFCGSRLGLDSNPAH